VERTRHDRITTPLAATLKQTPTTHATPATIAKLPLRSAAQIEHYTTDTQPDDKTLTDNAMLHSATYLTLVQDSKHCRMAQIPN